MHDDISIQTLITLNLQYNNIGDEGAQHLAQALQNNTVRQVLFRSTVHARLARARAYCTVVFSINV